MTTIVVSRSGQLARPGAHLVDLEETDALTSDAYGRLSPTMAQDADPAADREDTSAREIRWACEWWPPT